MSKLLLLRHMIAEPTTGAEKVAGQSEISEKLNRELEQQRALMRQKEVESEQLSTAGTIIDVQ